MAVPPGETLIRQWFDCFNERRLSDATALLAGDAVIAQVSDRPFQPGSAGYRQLASIWLTAFPDALLTLERVTARDEVTHEGHVVARGTHRGALDLGSLVFQPTGMSARLDVRVLLQLRNGLITYCSLSFDIPQLVDQLVIVDCAKLLEQVERIHKEGQRLAAAKDDAMRSREIVQRLGWEIDAARHAVRPYFRR